MLGLSGTSSYAVFVYLCICIFVFVCSAHGDIIFDILEQSSFQKYTISWVFLALRHMLYLSICVFCICIFVFELLAHLNIIFVILEQSSFQKYTTCWVFLALRHMLFLCICETQPSSIQRLYLPLFVCPSVPHGNIFQKMYGLYGLKHHTSGDVTMWDSAFGCWKAEFCNFEQGFTNFDLQQHDFGLQFKIINHSDRTIRSDTLDITCSWLP